MNKRSYFENDEDIVDIRKDNVFKSVFTREIPASRLALSKFVSALIGNEVTIVTIVANEPPVDNIRDRQMRFDINCKAQDGELVNVEMSFDPKPFELARLEFHIGKLFIGQAIRGEEKDYNDLKRAYQIAILANKKVFKSEPFFHSFEYYDPVNRESLNGKTRIITLELAKLDKVAGKPVMAMTAIERWAVYFQYLTDIDMRGIINEIAEYEEGIAMASEVIMTVSRDEEERARLMRDEKILLDYQSIRVSDRKEARKEGLEEGRKAGLEEGRKEGRKEGHIEILNFIAQGLSIDEIKQRLEHTVS